jgi:hypothetical protein
MRIQILSIALACTAIALPAAAETCIAEVSIMTSPAGKSGTETLGESTVASPSQCHQYARQAFAGNAAWHAPTKVCSRYPGQSVEVMASDYYKEMGKAGGVNHVDSYKVQCAGTVVWNHNLMVVKSTL